MVAASVTTKVIHYFLIALIVGFFAIPFATLCFFDCKFFVPKNIASVLLFFFREGRIPAPFLAFRFPSRFPRRQPLLGLNTFPLKQVYHRFSQISNLYLAGIRFFTTLSFFYPFQCP